MSVILGPSTTPPALLFYMAWLYILIVPSLASSKGDGSSQAHHLHGMSLMVLNQVFEIGCEVSSKSDAKKICAVKAIEYFASRMVRLLHLDFLYL